MSRLFELHQRPDLEAPVLIVALEGWIDAGLAAGSALSELLDQVDPVTVASFDTDILLDYRARRPVMHLVEGVNTSLTWPSVELRAGTDRAGNDLLLLVGAEPDHQWLAFTQAVVDVALEFGVRLTCGLGAYPAPVPHTRPVRLAATSPSEELLGASGLVRGSLDVPAGVEAAIEQRCAEVGLPAIGLWAQVPHYASAMPYPAGGAALLDGLAQVADVRVDVGPIREAAESSRRRLDALIAGSEEHRELVRQLEEHVDEQAGGSFPLQQPGQPLPSGDEIAAELQRFLRDQRGD
jgi:predicted ATP-grasp superfamily ATP-dependent carboligase